MDKCIIEHHIAKVYELLFLTTFFCGVGTFVNYYYRSIFLTLCGSIGSIIMIFAIKYTNKKKLNDNRYLYTLPFGFLVGLSLVPLVHVVNLQDESIIPLAGATTCLLFLGLTFISKFITPKLYVLGFVLFACLDILVFFSFLRLFVAFSETYQYVYLGCGLIIFSLLLAYDTENMKQRFIKGDIDYVHSAIILFFDNVNIFIRLIELLLITKKSKSHKLAQ